MHIHALRDYCKSRQEVVRCSWRVPLRYVARMHRWVAALGLQALLITAAAPPEILFIIIRNSSQHQPVPAPTSFARQARAECDCAAASRVWSTGGWRPGRSGGCWSSTTDWGRPTPAWSGAAWTCRTPSSHRPPSLSSPSVRFCTDSTLVSPAG